MQSHSDKYSHTPFPSHEHALPKKYPPQQAKQRKRGQTGKQILHLAHCTCTVRTILFTTQQNKHMKQKHFLALLALLLVGSLISLSAPSKAKAAESNLTQSKIIDGNTPALSTTWKEQQRYLLGSDDTTQADCSWGSCTLRFNRKTTRTIANNWIVAAAILESSCGFVALTSPPSAAVCSTYALTSSAIIQTRAKAYYDNGNCFGLKLPHVGVAMPHQVKRGTYNCN